MKFLKSAALAAGTVALLGSAAVAQSTNLRIQTHYGPETLSGKNAAMFVLRNASSQVNLRHDGEWRNWVCDRHQREVVRTIGAARITREIGIVGGLAGKVVPVAENAQASRRRRAPEPMRGAGPACQRQVCRRRRAELRNC